MGGMLSLATHFEIPSIGISAVVSDGRVVYYTTPQSLVWKFNAAVASRRSAVHHALESGVRIILADIEAGHMQKAFQRELKIGGLTLPVKITPSTTLQGIPGINELSEIDVRFVADCVLNLDAQHKLFVLAHMLDQFQGGCLSEFVDRWLQARGADVPVVIDPRRSTLQSVQPTSTIEETVRTLQAAAAADFRDNALKVLRSTETDASNMVEACNTLRAVAAGVKETTQEGEVVTLRIEVSAALFEKFKAFTS